jgi:hypothetical protein
MCGVAAHFIGRQGFNQTVLLALRRMRGTHIGEDIAVVLIDVVTKYEFRLKLRVFVRDNIESNDIV